MIRVLLAVVAFVASMSPCAYAESPRTSLSVTATVIAVVSGAEIDVIVTRSSVSETVAVGTIARVVYHGIRTPGPFDPLYMEAFDLNWNLMTDDEVYFDVAETPWDDEQRLHAYVYLDPRGYGMVNAILLASGLAAIDPALASGEAHANVLIEIAAVAERNGLGIWADTSGQSGP